MKKQQTPIVLISLLVVFGGAMIAMRQRPSDASATDPSLSKEVTGTSREEVSTKELTATLKKQTTPKTAAMLDPAEQAAKSEPAIWLPDYGDYKPTQNTTAATNQWWNGGVTKESN